MSQPAGNDPLYPAEFYAKLLGLKPADLTRLVKLGVIPKAKRSKYPLMATVKGHADHLREQIPASAAEALQKKSKQADFAGMVGITAPAVSRMFSDGILARGQTLHQWLLAYCNKLREEAAGRGGEDSAALSRARTREALAKAESQELENLKALGVVCLASDVGDLMTDWAMETQRLVMGALDRASERIESKYGIRLEPGDLESFGRTALEACSVRAGELADAIAESGEAPSTD